MPKFSILLVITALIGSLECRGVDLGLCGKAPVKCSCGSGSSSYSVFLYVEECTFIHRWKTYCDPCDEIEDEERCEPFRNCEECDVENLQCRTCPPTHYGLKCNLECTCQNGGVCDQISGKCICQDPFEGNKCELKKICQPPKVPFEGFYEPLQSIFQVGEHVNFRCKDGYYLEGSSSIQCLTTGEWNDISPTCNLKISCPVVANPKDGKVELPNGLLNVGIKINYSCNDGYELIGESTRVCLTDGSWSGNEPFCEKLIVCENLSEVENGKYTIEYIGSSEIIRPGTIVNFTCDDGRVAIGNEAIHCLQNGTWSDKPPLCVPDDNVCRLLKIIKHGTRRVEGRIGTRIGTGHKVVMHNTRIHYSCDELYYMDGSSNTTCQSTNNWTSSIPKCKKIITCGPLPNLDHGTREYRKPLTAPISSGSRGPVSRMGRHPRLKSPLENKPAIYDITLPEGHYHISTQARFKCQQYYKREGSEVRQCLANGDWSGYQPTCIPVCGQSNGPRKSVIYGGTVSDKGQWPWQAGIAVYDNTSQWILRCGGALISKYWVLTAAHCVYSKNVSQPLPLPREVFRVYLGKHYRNDSLDDDEMKHYTVTEIIPHPYYDRNSLDSDIALMHLSEPVEFTSRIQIVCLPEEDPEASQERLQEGKKGIVMGWGYTETGNLSKVLQYTEIPVVSNKVCVEDYAAANLFVPVTENMYCAGYKTGGHDHCPGDSGGPMVFPKDDDRKQWVLEGIVSWGFAGGCGRDQRYGGYVRVQRFMPWIKKHIG